MGTPRALGSQNRPPARAGGLRGGLQQQVVYVGSGVLRGGAEPGSEAVQIPVQGAGAEQDAVHHLVFPRQRVRVDRDCLLVGRVAQQRGVEHPEHHVAGARGVQDRVRALHSRGQAGASMVMATSSYNGSRCQSGPFRGLGAHAAERRAAHEGVRHHGGVEVRRGEDLLRPALADDVETHGAAGDRVVGSAGAGEPVVEVVLHHQPPVRPPEHLRLVLADPQHGVERQQEAHRLAGDGIDAVRAELLPPPARLRLGAAVEPADRRVQPVAAAVQRDDRLAHAGDGQGRDRLRLRHLAGDLADVRHRVAPQVVRRVHRPVGVAGVRMPRDRGTRGGGDPAAGHVVQVGLEVGGADVDAQQAGRRGERERERSRSAGRSRHRTVPTARAVAKWWSGARGHSRGR